MSVSYMTYLSTIMPSFQNDIVRTEHSETQYETSLLKRKARLHYHKRTNM